jgi:hypothetical protein
MLALGHWKQGLHWPAFVSLALIGFICLFYGHALVSVVVSLLIYGITIWPIGSTLADFPKSGKRASGPQSLFIKPPQTIPIRWPASPVVPLQTVIQRAREIAIPAGAIAAWLMFCAAYPNRSSAKSIEFLVVMHTLVAVTLIAARLLAYCVPFFPPMSVLGRVATGQYVIPGYDKVFVAPIVAALIAYSLPKILMALGVSDIVAIPVSTALTVWLVVLLPTRWEDWCFTGHHRISSVQIDKTPMIRSK